MASSPYEPDEGDVVVMFINKFTPETYDKGLAVQSEGFRSAIDESGQTRSTFWVADADKHEIIGISFFAKGHPVDDWHVSEHRLKVREQLEPLLREPTTVKHYTVIGKQQTG